MDNSPLFCLSFSITDVLGLLMDSQVSQADIISIEGGAPGKYRRTIS